MLETLKFATAMQHTLDMNGHKRGWQSMSNLQILRRIKDEVKELERAIRKHMEPENIQRESTDIANFCLFLWNNLETKAEGGSG